MRPTWHFQRRHGYFAMLVLSILLVFFNIFSFYPVEGETVIQDHPLIINNYKNTLNSEGPIHNSTLKISTRKDETKIPASRNEDDDIGINMTDRMNNDTSWCVISKLSMWPGTNVGKRVWGWSQSVAHTAESLFPCWSYFVRNGATSSCGFVLMKGLDHKPPILWAKSLMDAMNCSVIRAPTMQNISLLPSSIMTVKEFPFQEEFWFQTRKDAEALRNLVLPNPEDQAMDSSKLNVGIVLRSKTRQFRNVTALYDGLQARLGKNDTTAIFSLVDMKNLSLKEQAHWFATKHIIIAAHGAALTNAIFIQPGTTIAHLYPLHYYFRGYFESLATKAGGINLDWYAGNKSEAKDVHKETSAARREGAKKRRYLEPPVWTRPLAAIDEIVDIVAPAAERYYQQGVPRPARIAQRT
jgi:hypothetical protein